MDAFEIADVVEDQVRLGLPYYEFLRSQGLSLGLYFLAAGSSDPQQPHGEDEVYYVAQGAGAVTIGRGSSQEDRPVQAGSIIFVGKGVEHRFHSITDDLTLLVVFAPPRGSSAD